MPTRCSSSSKVGNAAKTPILPVIVAGAFMAHSIGSVLLRLVWALLTVIVGVWLIVEPHNGTLTLTLVLGMAYINSAVYLFTQMGAAIGRSIPELMLYVIGGFHIATIIAAMVFVALMAFRTLGGQYSGRDSEGIAAAAIFWNASVAIYIVIWYAVYVTK